MRIGGQDIRENLDRVREAIAKVAAKCGRDPEKIKIVVVSKGQPIGKIREAYAAGVRDFGENRVQEGIQKIESLSDLEDIRWHMIGHIQSRKARDILPWYSIVHSVDRMKIARRLERYAQQEGRKLGVYLECNVSGEESKYGWSLADRGTWDEIVPSFEEILEMPNLQVQGLMTMAPWTTDTEVVRSTFRDLRELQIFLDERLPGHWGELSMGMTDDYLIAIEEGATVLRIGRAILGERQ